MLTGDPAYRHHIIYQDDAAVVFLSKYPTLPGYTLVAPRRHREQVAGDFSADEYLALQHLIYRVAEALRRAVPAERIYIASLGSQQGNSHVHWHIVALPPGVPFAEQQFEAMRLDRGVLTLDETQMAVLAEAIRSALLVEHSVLK